MAKAHPFPPAWQEAIRHYEADQYAANREVRTVELRLYRLSKLAGLHPNGPGSVDFKNLTLYVGSDPRWKDNTRAIIQSAFKSFFRWAKKAKYIKSDPSKELRKISRGQTPNPAVATKTVKDALAGAKNDRSRLMLLLNSHGLAAMEIAQARPSDVQEIGGSFYLRVYGRKNKFEDVPISPDLAKTLRAMDREYVFPGKRSGHLSPAYISRLVSAELPPGVSSRNVRGTQRANLGLGQRKTWPELAPFHSPDALSFMELSELIDSETLRAQLRRVSRDIDNDPAAAIGACKEFLETLFKAVLDAKGVEHSQVPPFETFGQLFTKTADALALRSASVPGNEVASGALNTAVKGLAQVVEGVGNMRNKIGTGHGHGESPATPAHSHLVFNATVSIAEFVAVTWDEQPNTPT